MKKQILSEELKRMNKLAGLMNESDSVDEARYGRGSVDPWADIETGGEYSKSRDRVSASYKRQKEEDSLGSTSYQSFTNKIKRLGNLMTDDEAVEMMDDMKRMLSQDEIMDVYNFVDRNNISSPIYTYLDQYKGETGSYGSYGLEENDTKKVIDLNQYDSHILDQLRQKFARTYGDMPSDEELKNIISAMPELNKEGALDVMIKEGQLGKAITKMLIEEMLKENVDDVLKDEIQKVEPKNQTIQYVKDKVLDGKKYTVKYGGPGMPVGEYEMTIADLISRAWEAKVKKGIENWSDNDWSQIRDYINMKLS